jgi:hypothetical protein
MTEIIEQHTETRNEETKILRTPNFYTVVLEIERHVLLGWQVEKIITPPNFDFFLYEVCFVKNAHTLANVKASADAANEGKEVITKEKRQENMAKARNTRMAKIAAERLAAEGGGDES